MRIISSGTVSETTTGVDEFVATNAGVFVLAGGLQDQPATIVAADGTATGGPKPDAISGVMVVDVTTRQEALN